MFFIFLIYIYFHCWSSCSHQQITIFYTKGNKRLLMNLFQGQFAPLHYVSLLSIILDEKCTPIYANGRFLVLFFSPRNACISTVYHSTRKMHAHLRERKISCSFFFSQECMHLYCVSFYTKNARPSTRTEDFLFFFFSQEEKL